MAGAMEGHEKRGDLLLGLDGINRTELAKDMWYSAR